MKKMIKNLLILLIAVIGIDKVGATETENYTCNYKSASSDSVLSLEYSSDETGEKWKITYPGGKSIEYSNVEVWGNVMPSFECEDIYYDKHYNLILAISPQSETTSNNLTLYSLCQKYHNNISEVEQFCSSNGCYYGELVCKDVYNYKCEGIENLPAALPVFTRNILNLVKYLVPVMLVILGMLDLAKAMTSNDEKAMKDSQNKLIKRGIGAVSVFLVIALTQFIFKVIGTDSTNSMAACLDCFVNANCEVGQGEEELTTEEKIKICKEKATKTCYEELNPASGLTGGDMDQYLGWENDFEYYRDVARCETRKFEACELYKGDVGYCSSFTYDNCPSIDSEGKPCEKIETTRKCISSSIKKDCEDYTVNECPTISENGDYCKLETITGSTRICTKDESKKHCGLYSYDECPEVDDYGNECMKERTGGMSLCTKKS